jgi:uncharacterized protein YjbJ (UPF0337 family)
MQGDRDFKARQRRAMVRAAAARAALQRRLPAPAAAAGDNLTSEGRIPTMRSARQDKIRGRIDKIAGRVLEWFGRLTGNRSTVMKGKAARGRGMGRTAMGRLKRIGH